MTDTSLEKLGEFRKDGKRHPVPGGRTSAVRLGSRNVSQKVTGGKDPGDERERQTARAYTP